MTALVAPSLDRYDAWAAAVRDFSEERMAGSGWWNLPEELHRSTSPEACEAVVTAADRESDTSRAAPPGLVHAVYFWIAEGTAVVGFITVRHALNEWLLDQGGHIGYSVRPSRRRAGHATRALALALARAAEIGVTSALLTCDDDNAGSVTVIERNGGVLEDVRGVKRRYWVPTATSFPR